MLAGCMIDSLNAWSNHVSSLTFRAPRKRFASTTWNPVFVAGLKQRQSLKYVLVYISGSVSNDTSQINQHYWKVDDYRYASSTCFMSFSISSASKIDGHNLKKKKNNPSQILSWTSSPDCDEGESAQLISTHGISDGSRKNMTVTVKRKLFFLNFKLPNHQGGICHRRKPNANKAQEKEMKMCHENQNCWQTFQVMITDFNAISLGIVRMFTRQDKLLTETQKNYWAMVTCLYLKLMMLPNLHQSQLINYQKASRNSKQVWTILWFMFRSWENEKKNFPKIFLDCF